MPSQELVIERVTLGEGVMPSYAEKLSEQEIADVAAYVVQATSGS
jgi:mono/diheme cytochrome c family protein